MDHAIDCYRRFLSGDNSGLEEIICRFKDGLILYLNGYVNDLGVAEELTEETFVKLVVKRPRFLSSQPLKHGFIPLAGMWQSIICGEVKKRNCLWRIACRFAMRKKT